MADRTSGTTTILADNVVPNTGIYVEPASGLPSVTDLADAPNVFVTRAGSEVVGRGTVLAPEPSDIVHVIGRLAFRGGIYSLDRGELRITVSDISGNTHGLSSSDTNGEFRVTNGKIVASNPSSVTGSRTVRLTTYNGTADIIVDLRNTTLVRPEGSGSILLGGTRWDIATSNRDGLLNGLTLGRQSFAFLPGGLNLHNVAFAPGHRTGTDQLGNESHRVARYSGSKLGFDTDGTTFTGNPPADGTISLFTECDFSNITGFMTVDALTNPVLINCEYPTFTSGTTTFNGMVFATVDTIISREARGLATAFYWNPEIVIAEIPVDDADNEIRFKISRINAVDAGSLEVNSNVEYWRKPLANEIDVGYTDWSNDLDTFTTSGASVPLVGSADGFVIINNRVRHAEVNSLPASANGLLGNDGSPGNTNLNQAAGRASALASPASYFIVPDVSNYEVSCRAFRHYAPVAFTLTQDTLVGGDSSTTSLIEVIEDIVLGGRNYTSEEITAFKAAYTHSINGLYAQAKAVAWDDDFEFPLVFSGTELQFSGGSFRFETLNGLTTTEATYNADLNEYELVTDNDAQDIHITGSEEITSLSASTITLSGRYVENLALSATTITGIALHTDYVPASARGTTFSSNSRLEGILNVNSGPGTSYIVLTRPIQDTPGDTHNVTINNAGDGTLIVLGPTFQSITDGTQGVTFGTGTIISEPTPDTIITIDRSALATTDTVVGFLNGDVQTGLSFTSTDPENDIVVVGWLGRNRTERFQTVPLTLGENATIVLTPGDLLPNVPDVTSVATASFSNSLTPMSDSDNDPDNALVLTIGGTPLSAPVNAGEITSAIADARNTSNYLEGLFRQLTALSIDIPTTGFITYTVCEPTEFGADFRDTRLVLASDAMTDIQIIANGRTLSEDEFSPDGLTETQLETPSARPLTQGLPNIPGVLFDDRDTAVSPDGLNTELNSRGLTRANVDNIGLGVPAVDANGFRTTVNTRG